MASPSADELRAYASRDWELHARAKDAGLKKLSPNEALDLSQAMFDHMRSIDPHWPSEAERQADLEHHMKWTALMRRLRDVGFTG